MVGESLDAGITFIVFYAPSRGTLANIHMHFCKLESQAYILPLIVWVYLH